MAARKPDLIRAAALLLAALPVVAAAATDLFAPRGSQTLLDVDEAFRVLPPQRMGDRLRIEWDIAPGYFIYRNRISVSAAAPAGAKLGPLDLPQGQPHHDAQFGVVEIYRNDAVGTATGAATVTRVHVRYQGCADAGICYPPQDKELAVTPATTP